MNFFFSIIQFILLLYCIHKIIHLTIEDTTKPTPVIMGQTPHEHYFAVIAEHSTDTDLHAGIVTRLLRCSCGLEKAYKYSTFQPYFLAINPDYARSLLAAKNVKD